MIPGVNIDGQVMVEGHGVQEAHTHQHRMSPGLGIIAHKPDIKKSAQERGKKNHVLEPQG